MRNAREGRSTWVQRAAEAHARLGNCKESTEQEILHATTMCGCALVALVYQLEVANDDAWEQHDAPS